MTTSSAPSPSASLPARWSAGSRDGWSSDRARSATASIVTDPRRHDHEGHPERAHQASRAIRPFAPSVLAEEVGEWYEQDYTSPYMILVYKTRAEKRDAIPAVNHVDDTGRVQSVEERVTPRYYRLISAFNEADRRGRSC